MAKPKNNISDEIYDEMIKRFSYYFVGLAEIKINDNKEELRFLGSGTLVTILGRHCILTAHHVLEIFPSSGMLAIIRVTKKNQFQKYQYNLDSLKIYNVARGKDDQAGPDLGIVELPSIVVDALKVNMNFYNIDKIRDRLFCEPPSLEDGAWAACGIPSEYERKLPPNERYENIVRHEGISVFATRLAAVYDDAQFDYYEIDIDYTRDNVRFPESFGGMSGGGIWQILFSKDSEGILKPTQYILSGLIFYQSDMNNGKRKIRCHGRKSIYEYLYDYMQNKR